MDYRKEREEFSISNFLRQPSEHCRIKSNWPDPSKTAFFLVCCLPWCFQAPLTKRRSNERIYPMTSTNTFTTLQSQDHGCHLSKTKKNISWLFTTDHRLRNEGTINNDTKKHICHTRLIPTLYIWKYMFMHNIYIHMQVVFPNVSIAERQAFKNTFRYHTMQYSNHICIQKEFVQYWILFLTTRINDYFTVYFTSSCARYPSTSCCWTFVFFNSMSLSGVAAGEIWLKNHEPWKTTNQGVHFKKNTHIL